MKYLICDKCRRKLSSLAILEQHQEQYCRYRKGKKAKQPVVVRQRGAVEVDDGRLLYSDESVLERASVSMNGRARDFRVTPDDEVLDAQRWLIAEEALVRQVYDLMNEYLVRGRMVLCCWFLKRDPSTQKVLSRDRVFLSSLSAENIHDFHSWYTSHILAIIKNLESFTKQDSAL